MTFVASKALTLAVAGLLLTTAAAVAEQPKSLLQSPENWGAFTIQEDGGKTCYLAGQPQDSKPENVKRGPIWLLVTHRPYRKIAHEVSIYIGYPFKKDSKVDVEIDGEHFDMFTDGETAWAENENADQALTKAMRAGLKLVVKGTSSRGTDTVDTYSLRGFTRAHDAINQACNVSF